MHKEDKKLIKPPLPKRFYKNICVARAEQQADKDGPKAASFSVLLDGRGVKTPARRALRLPRRALAELIADEFRRQKEVIDPRQMPITRLANTVLDAIADDMQPVQEDILRYLACDMVFYRAEAPEKLMRRQAEGWDKALDWAQSIMGAEFTAQQGVMFIKQKPEAMASASAYLRQWTAAWERQIAGSAPFAVAALHLMISLTGSALLGLMAEAGALEMQEVWKLAHLEADWTAEQWGEDAEALAKRADAEAEFYAAAAVLAGLKAG